MTKIKVCLILAVIPVFFLLSQPMLDNNKPRIISELTEPNLVIKEGLLSLEEDTVTIKRNDKVIAKVLLSKPVMIAQADKEEKWGYFQFPSIYRNEYGKIIAAWQLADDSHTAYGKAGDCRMVSDDEGETWKLLDEYCFRKGSYRVEFDNGDILQVVTPAAKDVASYSLFPQTVSTDTIRDKHTLGGYLFYPESELPDELRGIYLKRWNRFTRVSDEIHANLNDPGLLRYAIDGMMPVLWLGDIKELNDGSLISCVYPGYYQNSQGEVLHSAISIYKSQDKGNNWSIIGKIHYQTGTDYESCLYDGDEGFSEPTFELLNDGSFLCVMRSGQYSPMYKSVSTDGGLHWSVPEAFTPNGVKPHLLRLNSGVLVLTSGRPGVQIRFNIDGDGKFWTEPIDMMPFMDKHGNYGNSLRLRETCGYTCIMAADEKSFYIVYSDFKTHNSVGEERKAIFFRKVTIEKL